MYFAKIGQAVQSVLYIYFFNISLAPARKGAKFSVQMTPNQSGDLVLLRILRKKWKKKSREFLEKEHINQTMSFGDIYICSVQYYSGI